MLDQNREEFDRITETGVSLCWCWWSPELELRDAPGEQRERYQVSCAGCGAQGPLGNTPADAANGWEAIRAGMNPMTGGEAPGIADEPVSTPTDPAAGGES